MTPRLQIRSRGRAVRNAAVIGTAALAGLALGAGGVSLALWNDGVTFDGEIASGYEFFAAGRPGHTQPAENGTAVVTIGTSEANALVDDGEIAIPLQTDSISQGNKGLRYEVIEPDWGSSVFGAADVAVFPVDSAEQCTAGAAQPTGDLTSTPISADYSTTETPVTEFWCLVAVLDGLPGEGDYLNTAEVTAEDASGAEVSDEDSWNAGVLSPLDPDDEPDHEIEFRYDTFRPGEVTP